MAGICGSDLHLYDGYIPAMRDGDILGHEELAGSDALGELLVREEPVLAAVLLALAAGADGGEAVAEGVAGGDALALLGLGAPGFGSESPPRCDCLVPVADRGGSILLRHSGAGDTNTRRNRWNR